jgi:hypothetical protein
MATSPSATVQTIATIQGTAPAPVEQDHFLRQSLYLAERTAEGVESMLSGSGGSSDSAACDQALAASKVIKGSAGSLKSLSIYNSGPAQFILIMNAASLPANGVVTLLFPPIPVAAASVTVIDFPRALAASTGIVVCNSSTAPSKTIGSADCIFGAQFN